MPRDMKKRRKMSLVTFLVLSTLCISLLPVIIYSALSMLFFTRGLDSVHELQLKKYMHDYIERGEGNLPFNFITITTNLDSLPKSIRENIPSEMEPDIYYKKLMPGTDGTQTSLYCMMLHQNNGKNYYAVQKIYKTEAEQYIKPQITYTVYILLGTGFIILIALAIFIRYLLDRIKSPMTMLKNWLNKINYENINKGLPDFTYPELQEIAIFIQKNLSEQYSRLKNEELFWRYCSHELRTPISAIGVGLDVLQRLILSKNCSSIKANEYLNKIKQKVRYMSQVIEALLWLGRGNDGDLPRQIFDLSELVEEVVHDINTIYNYPDKNIKIKLSRHLVQCPCNILRIMLENMVRNAFQHSFGHEIFILQIKNRIVVINSITDANNLPENLGFGLGIEITERIANKFEWDFKIHRNTKYNVCTLFLPERK